MGGLLSTAAFSSKGQSLHTPSAVTGPRSWLQSEFRHSPLNLEAIGEAPILNDTLNTTTNYVSSFRRKSPLILGKVLSSILGALHLFLLFGIRALPNFAQ